jgi:hypothetical protein
MYAFMMFFFSVSMCQAQPGPSKFQIEIEALQMHIVRPSLLPLDVWRTIFSYASGFLIDEDLFQHRLNTILIIIVCDPLLKSIYFFLSIPTTGSLETLSTLE